VGLASHWQRATDTYGLKALEREMSTGLHSFSGVW